GGIGVLPCFMADGLSRVLAEHVLIERRLWLSIHRETHDTARSRAVRRWLKDLVQAEQARLRPFR
ncbi:MAG TPA: LysR family transcriptional regulator, partial [Phenylobacterium sp.]